MYLIAICWGSTKRSRLCKGRLPKPRHLLTPQASNSGKEARFLQLLNETLENFAPQEALELAAESLQAVPADLSVSVSYTAFEEAP